MFAFVFKKELVEKANPYHGTGGRFTTQGKATFVSTGGAFSRSNQKAKDEWDSGSRSTQPADRAKGAKKLKDVLSNPNNPFINTQGTTVKAKGSRVTIREPILSNDPKVVDRLKAQSEKDWAKGGLNQKDANDSNGIETNHVATRVVGDGQTGKRKNGKDVPPYYLETDVDVISTKKKKTTRKISGWGADMGLINRP